MKQAKTSLTKNSLRIPARSLRRITRLTRKPSGAATQDDFFGQERARDAAVLAASIKADGFNLFVATPSSVPVKGAIKSLLKEHAEQQAAPSDWVYVFNFANPHAPRALKFPPGKAKQFKKVVRLMIEELRQVIPAQFEKPEYQNQIRALNEAFQLKQENAFEKLGQDARERGIAIVRTPMGFSLAPMRDDKVVSPDVVKLFSDDEQKNIKLNLKQTEDEMEIILQNVPKWERELRDGLKNLERSTVEAAITESIDVAKSKLCTYPIACEHLDAVRDDLIDNVALFSHLDELSDILPMPRMDSEATLGPFDRYDVNVLVDNSHQLSGAPVIEENHPTLAHLVGRVEHRAESGVLTTNFKLIKPGAFHMANGGFLILDARRLLSESMSWFALKRALQTGCIKTESLAEALSLTSTITLDPAPIPLSIKIVLVGDARIYHLLMAFDPEFSDYFKLLADFELDTERNKDQERAYAEAIHGLAKSKGLLAIDKLTYEGLIEEAARIAGDACRMSLAMDKQSDILFEANHIALSHNRSTICRDDLRAALKARDRRQARIRDRLHDFMMRDVSLIKTDGSVTGQINGLSVYQFGRYAFGKPNRITARTRPGPGRVIDIEREVKLGGPLHSKGVLILSGYIAGKYVPDRPLSLLVSLVMEQSYGGIDGDSASLAELITILSSLSGIPVKQSLAVTGAINQHGDVQAIGGVNEKIEGFYALCDARGLTGEQGVIIPESNAQHLMLDEKIVAACKAGLFHVFAVKTVDQALHLTMDHAPDDVHEAVRGKLLGFAAAIANTQPSRGEPESPDLSVGPAAPVGPPPEPIVGLPMDDD